MTTRKNDKTGSGHIWLLVLFALVMLLMAAAISFSAQTYGRALGVEGANNRLCSIEGYLDSTFKASDAEGSVSVEAGPQGGMLVVADRYGAYETCIYLYDGQLVQEYKSVASDLAPQAASPIAELSRFEPKVEGRTVTVICDEGTFVNTLRGGGETR